MGACPRRLFRSAVPDYDPASLIIWHTTKVDHVIGLDPNYLAYSDLDLFTEWIRINANQVESETDLSEFIYHHFKADWILIAIRPGNEIEDRELAQRLATSKKARLVLATKRAALFKLGDPEDSRNRNPRGE